MSIYTFILYIYIKNGNIGSASHGDVRRRLRWIGNLKIQQLEELIFKISIWVSC